MTLRDQLKIDEGVKHGKITIECACCGKSFAIFPSRLGRSKFCSRKCNAKFHIKHLNPNPKLTTVSCARCGKAIARKTYTLKLVINNYCSNECKSADQIREHEVKCITCGREVTRHPCEISKYSGSYCSRECYNASVSLRQKGKHNPAWKGGVTSETNLIRRSSQMEQWRNAVFARDNYTCLSCDSRGGYLHAHHIKQFALYPELRFDVGNGMTLCKPCHKKWHDEHGWRNEVT